MSVFAHEGVFLLVDFHFSAAIFADEDAVPNFDLERQELAVLVFLAGAQGDHLGRLRLFLGAVRDDDSADLLFAFVEALNNDAVVQRSDVNALYSVCRKVEVPFASV